MNYYEKRLQHLTEWLNKFPNTVNDSETLKRLKANCKVQITQIKKL